MPKAKYRAERGSRALARTIKYKLGNRKSSTSAHSLSTDELLKQYEHPKQPKDKYKILQVLRLRKVNVADRFAQEETIEA